MESNKGTSDARKRFVKRCLEIYRAYLFLAIMMLLGGALLALLIAGGVYYFRPKPVAELYLVSPVQKRDIVQRIEAAGRLDVRKRVEIPSPVEGRLISINVKAGDTVAAGQLLDFDSRLVRLLVSLPPVLLGGLIIALSFRRWEDNERAITDHTQRISLMLGWPTTWPPAIRARTLALAGKSKWLVRQRTKTALHVPTGT